MNPTAKPIYIIIEQSEVFYARHLPKLFCLLTVRMCVSMNNNTPGGIDGINQSLMYFAGLHCTLLPKLQYVRKWAGLRIGILGNGNRNFPYYIYVEQFARSVSLKITSRKGFTRGPSVRTSAACSSRSRWPLYLVFKPSPGSDVLCKPTKFGKDQQMPWIIILVTNTYTHAILDKGRV